MGRNSKIDSVLDRADPVELVKLFKDKRTRLTIEKRIDSGKYSLLDMLFFKCFEGDTKVLLSVFGKLYPDTKAKEAEGVGGNFEVAWKNSNLQQSPEPKNKTVITLPPKEPPKTNE